MNLLSIDYSISGPTICIYDTELKTYKMFSYGSKYKEDFEFKKENFHIIFSRQPKKENKDFWRKIRIANKIIEFIGENCKPNFTKTILEGYSYASTGLVFDIAEATGMMKYQLLVNGFEFDIIPSPQWKKFLFNKGNMKKNQLLEKAKDSEFSIIVDEFKERGFSKNLTNPLDDYIDAYFIVKYLESI